MTDNAPSKHVYVETLNADKSLTIELQYPFNTPTGDVISSVTLQRMKQKTMKSLRAQFKKAEDFGDAMLAKSLQLTDEDIGELDMEDFAYIQERFSNLVGFGTNEDAK